MTTTSTVAGTGSPGQMLWSRQPTLLMLPPRMVPRPSLLGYAPIGPVSVFLASWVVGAQSWGEPPDAVVLPVESATAHDGWC